MSDTKVTNFLVPLVSAVTTVYNGIKFITGTFTNIRTKGYSLSTINIAPPYGQFSVPPAGLKGVLVPIEDSNKLYANVGFLNSLPPIPYTPAVGDSGQYSLNYCMVQNSTGIMAYRISDNSYSATLINGNWANKILTDIITRLNQIESLYNSHVHSGVQTGGGTSAVPVVLMPDDPDLIADASAISDGKTLINNNGTIP
jgi:hypothetical protein